MTRVYVPATIDLLRAWYADGAVPESALADAYEAPDETEEGEYAALMSAADDARALEPAGRRVVVVVDAGSLVPVAFDEVLAVHADAVDGAADDEDLAWFAVQEVGELLG